METKEKRKYCVTIHQVISTTSWSDYWEATGCDEDDTIPDWMCVTEKAFD